MSSNFVPEDYKRDCHEKILKYYFSTGYLEVSTLFTSNKMSTIQQTISKMQEILPFIFYILFSSRLNCIITYKYRFRKYTRVLTEGFCQGPRIFSESSSFSFGIEVLSSFEMLSGIGRREAYFYLLLFFPLLSNNIEYFFQSICMKLLFT